MAAKIQAPGFIVCRLSKNSDVVIPMCPLEVLCTFQGFLADFPVIKCLLVELIQNIIQLHDARCFQIPLRAEQGCKYTVIGKAAFVSERAILNPRTCLHPNGQVGPFQPCRVIECINGFGRLRIAQCQ